MKSKKRQPGFSQWTTRILCGCLFALVIVVLAACSTKKNTPGTRMYHSLTARYNAMYNGRVAYDNAIESQTKAHKEDYNRLLPFYVCMNKSTASSGKSGFETAITKCEKAIKVHSIKKRPANTNTNKRKSEREKAYLARKEFNPVLYKAWLMMADAQFRSGEFFEAASTYNYILRLYATQPDVVCIARARLARCYVALQWPYDAEDLLRKMSRDSITRKGKREYADTRAAYLIQTNQYEEAIPLLRETAKHTKGKLARARLRFLEGQLLHELGRNEEAYKAFGRVTRAHPPYELTFNARIMQTEVMPRSKYRQMISRLKSMARDDKNKDYLDKVYYAMGNIYLGVKDTTKCLYTWEMGVEKGTRNGSDKAALLLRLGNLYWEKEMYVKSAEAYKKCVSILDKEHEEYEETKRREKILSELSPHLAAVELQDSLQELARMPESGYMAAIDRVIDALKKKEKEEAKKAGREAAANATATQRANMQNNPVAAVNELRTENRLFYFYNANAVKRGEQEFQKRWGARPNEDYWRISNKRSLPRTDGFEESDYDYDEAAADSLFGSGGDDLASGGKELDDSLANDPHHREYYLKQIPFTDEQMDASHAILSDGLFNAGIIEQEQLENFPLAEQTMLRLLNEYPDYETRDQIYYHLFLLYGRLDRIDEAEAYRQKLLEEFPESRLAELLGNPYYEQIARNGKHMEDSLYADAYDAYQQSDYERVEKNYTFSTANFPHGKNRARMLFIRAMSQLYGGSRDSFMVSLKEVVQNYSKEEVGELARAIMKGLDEGRLLMDDRYDASSIWGRRKQRAENDSTEVPELKDDRITTFNFVLAYPTNSLDQNQLLFEMARYNFSNFMVRNFDLDIQEQPGLTLMLIRGFQSFDEVHAYVQKLYADEHMSTILEGIRTLLISDYNLGLIGTEYSFDDYKEFYDQYFAPLEVPEELPLDEPTDIEFRDPDDVDPNEGTEDEDNSTDSDDDFFDMF